MGRFTIDQRDEIIASRGVPIQKADIYHEGYVFVGGGFEKHINFNGGYESLQP